MITDQEKKYTLPDNLVESDMKQFSLAVPVALANLQQHYPGFRVEKPLVYVDKEKQMSLFIVSDVTNGGNTIATAMVELLKNPGSSPRNRWKFQKIELLSQDNSPISQEEAKEAAAKAWTHPAMAGRPLDAALALKIADLILDTHGSIKKATTSAPKKGRKSK